MRSVCVTIVAVEKAMTITNSECLFAHLGIQHAMRVHLIVRVRGYVSNAKWVREIKENGTRHSLLPRSVLFLVPNRVCIFWRTCAHIHISDCVQTVHELPLLPNINASETFLHKTERCEVLTGYLSLGCRSGGDWANTWHWTERSTVLLSNRK